MDSQLWMQYEDVILTVCVGGLMAYMVFIIYRLAKDSNAGKWGYFTLFLALGLGMVGFIAKAVIMEMMKQ